MGTKVSKSPLFNGLPASFGTRLGRFALITAGTASLMLAGCGGNAGGIPSQSGVPGSEVMLPGGSGATFFVDENVNGEATSFRIVEMIFGRLVDIHDIDGMGLTNPEPIFQDFLIEPDIVGGAGFRVESNPLTGAERLVVLAERAVDPTAFNTLLATTTDNLIQVVSRNDNGLDPGPFSIIPRNCSVSLRFNDMLSDGPADVAALTDNVKMMVGNLPSQPFFARTFFDPNHGALLAGEFHSTRVILDFAVSPAEAAASGGALMSNVIGLPVGDNTTDPNVSIRIPTRTVAAGQSTIQTTLLRAVNGVALDVSNNGPMSTNATLDVVRAFRPANANQANNGFLADIIAPQILGSWGMTVDAAGDDMTGDASFDFLIDMTFDTACRSSVEVGDLIELGSNMLLATAVGTPDMAGTITGLAVRSLSPIASAASLLGGGFFVSPLDPTLMGVDGCWVTFSPAPATPITGTGPVAGVSTTANFRIRFSEAMDPSSMSVLDRMTVIAGDNTVEPTAINRVAGSYVADPDFQAFTMVHPLPFSHQTGVADFYTITTPLVLPTVSVLPTDLAGNVVTNPLPTMEFTINPTDVATDNSSLILRFDRAYQEDDPAGSPTLAFSGVNEVDNPNSTSAAQIEADFSGALTIDLQRGEIRGRKVEFESFVIDNTRPTVAAMGGGAFSTNLPLNRLGAKTQTMWRLFDMGMYSNQADTLDVDVVGLSWAPSNGVVVSDFYPSFEIRLGTSQKVADETVNMATPQGLVNPDSGLDSMGLFAASSLGGAPLQVVHNRAKGYTVRTIDRFNASTGLPMIPFPMNQRLAAGEAMTSYTWRDSSNLLTSDQAISIPTPVEVAAYAGMPLPPNNLESETDEGIHASGAPKQAAVMPLLMEFNCFSSSNAIGTNRFAVGLLAPGIDPMLNPITRLFSAGGTNILGFPVTVNPDAAFIPSGGFNAAAGGTPTLPGDNTYYLGQLDTVFRVTRLVSHWIDLIGSAFTGALAFDAPILEPAQSQQPLGTSIQLAFRSATGFAGSGTVVNVRPYQPAFHGPNGDPVDHLDNGSVHSINFQAANMTTNTADGRIWNSDITQMKSRFLQMRITFVNNINTGATPFLSALALPFDR